MNIGKIDHVGIAVKSLDESLKLYRDTMGLEVMEEEVVEDQKVKIVCLKCGETRVELLEATSEESPIAKFIESKGEGIHHIAYRVKDIESAIETMKRNDIRMIDEKPRHGAGGAKIAFAHPKSTKGVLTELCERKDHE